MPNETIVGRYKGGSISGEILEGAIRDALREVSNDPEALTDLSRYGIDQQALDGFDVSVNQAPGLAVETVVLAITLATAGEFAADGIKAVWRLVVRKVQDEKGKEAFGTERPEGS
jgi:hypothetical protein